MVKHADAGHDAATEQKDAAACSVEAGIAAYGSSGY
jgi:hypothetical protein